MKHVVTVVIAAVVAFLISYLAKQELPPFAGDKRVVHATILVSGNPGECRGKVFPDVVYMQKNEDIEWTVADVCGDTASANVEIRWIDHPDSNPEVGNDPLASPASDRKRARRALKAGVRRYDKFRYEVWLNDRRLADPDVEIMQF